MAAEPSTSSSTPSKPTRPLKPRSFTRIPLFIVENHNDVLELLLPALANRYLPFENNLMVHFDSHPDLCVPRLMSADAVFKNRSELLESLSIENWIVPMMYAGHINEVVWVHPPWAHQMPDGCHTFSIGNYDNKIMVSSTLDYFLSDGLYKEEKLLKNKKEVSIVVSEVDERLNELLRDDSEWILDIDLDYFSTINPFLMIYPKAETYKKLRDIYKVQKSYDSTDAESIVEYVKERNRLLDFFETVFQHMAQHGSLERFKFDDTAMNEKFELAKELIECLVSHYSIYDIDWFVVNDAGCTCDEAEFEVPQHESTDEEIKMLVNKLEKFLKSLKKPPTIITIARSSLDGYTPNAQVEQIQSQVLRVLRNVYAESLGNEVLWYKTDAEGMLDDVSALEMVEPRKK